MKPDEFFAKYAPFAVESMKTTGIPASVTLAQAAIESAWGEKAYGNNFFGIKAFTETAKAIRKALHNEKEYSQPLPANLQLWWTHEFVNGAKIKIQDVFMRYATPLDSFNDHADFFVRNSRYAKALAVKHDALAFAKEIALAGYATAPTYYASIESMINKYKLTSYDM